MSIVIARSRARMYTAFITNDGRRILNIMDIIDRCQQCVSIEFDPADDAGLASNDPAVVTRLLAQGRRLPITEITPCASEPVQYVVHDGMSHSPHRQAA